MIAIPPELFELLNWARATVSLIIVSLTGYYMLAEYRKMRSEMSLTRSEAITNLRGFRLAFGTIIAFSGEFMIAAYIAAIRFIDPSPIPGKDGWPIWIVAIPVVGTATLVLGGACIARSIYPREWGRFAYWTTFGLVALVLVVVSALR